MRKKYLISLTLLIIFLLLLFNFSGNLAAFIDLPSFVGVIAIPFIMIFTSYSWREFRNSFSLAFREGEDLKEYKKAHNMFLGLSKLSFCGMIILIITGVIMILSNVGDITKIGPPLAITILSTLYTYIIYVAIIYPFQFTLKKRIIEAE